MFYVTYSIKGMLVSRKKYKSETSAEKQIYKWLIKHESIEEKMATLSGIDIPVPKIFTSEQEILLDTATKTVDFYKSSAWLKLRAKALHLYGNICQCCGKSPKDGICIHVDHIKPRSEYPELELDISNLQILCNECNMGKLNRYEVDWRG